MTNHTEEESGRILGQLKQTRGLFSKDCGSYQSHVFAHTALVGFLWLVFGSAVEGQLQEGLYGDVLAWAMRLVAIVYVLNFSYTHGEARLRGEAL